MRARSLPSPTPCLLRRYASAVRPVITDRPAGSFSPEYGSSTALLTHTGTPPTASAIATVLLKLNRAAYGIVRPVRWEVVPTTQPSPPRMNAVFSGSCNVGGNTVFVVGSTHCG